MEETTEEHKTGGGESSIAGESSLVLISRFQVGEGDDAEGVEGGCMFKVCSFGWGCYNALENGVGVNGSVEMGMYLDSEQRVDGCQFSGT
jgi:hypothetical protein